MTDTEILRQREAIWIQFFVQQETSEGCEGQEVCNRT